MHVNSQSTSKYEQACIGKCTCTAMYIHVPTAIVGDVWVLISGLLHPHTLMYNIHVCGIHHA